MKTTFALFVFFLVPLGIDRNFCCGESHKFKNDDYFEKFYLRKVPKLKVSPYKVNQFFVNHLRWFPEDNVRNQRLRKQWAPVGHLRSHVARARQPEGDLHPFRPGKVKHSDKNYNESLPNQNFTTPQSTPESTPEAVYCKEKKPVFSVVAHIRIPEKVKNLTRPFSPRVNNPDHTTQLRYMKTLSTTTTTEVYIRPMSRCFSDNIYSAKNVHQKIGLVSSPFEKRRISTFPGRRQRRFRIAVNVDYGQRQKKADTREKQTDNGNNSSHVLETAEEMATDLAGRVTNLWKCVVRTHRNPNVRDIKYYLYTRRNIIEPEELAVNYALIQKMSSSIKPDRADCAAVDSEDIEDFQRIKDQHRQIIKSNFLSLKAPTKILIHGYTGSHKDNRMVNIKDAYLVSGRFNVIQVDWETLAAPPCYIRVTHHSRFVGETVAKFIDGLRLIGVNMSLVHIIGFSLGAQVAGFVGNSVTLTNICRITGLDPALPLFLHTNSAGHLDKTDADFVDVIHTCGGILAMFDPLGHVDFYPNGGSRQPGCEISNLKCSHSRAPQYFAESVTSAKKFTGQLCPSWEDFIAGGCNSSLVSSFMGEPCSLRSKPGKYYLVTKSKEPFAT